MLTSAPRTMDSEPAKPTAITARPLGRRIAWGLAALTLVALIARMVGIGSMLPHVPQVDEQILYSQVFVEDGLELPESKVPLPYAYPTLIARVLHLVVPRPEACDAHTTEEHLHCAARVVEAMRVWLCLVAALGVPLLFFLARRFVPDPVALLAAAWLAFSVLHAWYSSQARPHGTLCTVVLLAMIACVDLRRRPDAGSYVRAGLATALAASMLQSGVFVIPAFVIAHLLREQARARRAWLWFAATLAFVFACVIGFNHHPPHVTDASSPGGGGGLMSLLLDKMHGLDLSYFKGRGFSAMLDALANYDPWLSAFAALGVVVVVVRVVRARTAGERVLGARARDTSVLLAHFATHVIAFGVFNNTFQRFLMPVVPLLCLLAAIAVASCARALSSRASTAAGRTRISVAVVALVLMPQAFACIKVAWLHVAPDTLSSASTWIAKNLDHEHARIAVAPTLELPLMRRPEDLPAYLGADALTFSLWIDYQVGLRSAVDPREIWNLENIPFARADQREKFRKDPDGFVRTLAADYVVVDVNHDDRRQILDVLRKAVMKQGHLVAHFGPREPTRAGDVPILYQLDGPLAPDAHFAWRVMEYAAQGPDVEIWKLDR